VEQGSSLRPGREFLRSGDINLPKPWTALVLDTFVMVIGIFLGLQITG
jgi:hypothetical protein